MFPGDTPGAESPDLSAALEQLWRKFLPQLEERIAVLERAVEALSAGRLSGTLQADAHTAAHKLSGSLGTFGLASGTALAREAELLCSEDWEIARDAGARLAEIAAQLRAILANRG
ncbi:MAG TPA: Hpt domain-containing protein [Terracidiphilus sp.]|nr:Hpt domain-containing protein [Terracidiphilus sp.]